MRTQVHTNNLEKQGLEGGDSMFLQNTATCLQVCVVSQHMRRKCQMCRVLKSRVPRRHLDITENGDNYITGNFILIICGLFNDVSN
jgi:hypothetical protein